MRLAARARRAIRLVRGRAQLSPRDRILASFPRSGNTWLRFLLANLVSLAERDGREPDFDELNRMMPELGLDDLSRPWPYRTLPRIVKTHREYHRRLAGVPSILLVRDPRDAIVSYFHFARDNREIAYPHGFERFARDPRFGLEAWFRHWASWQGHHALLIQYEVLRSDTAGQLRRLLAVAGASLDDATLDEAIRRCAVDRIRSLEARSALPERFGADFRFARDGRSQQWREFFDDALIERYAALRSEHGLSLYP